MSASIVLRDEAFRAQFALLVEGAKKPKAILLGVGREAVRFLKRHFREKDRKEPNALSPRRSHFWNEVANSVMNPVPVGESAVSVAITDGRFRQKLFGGPITPKAASMLTIPVSEEAYGRTAKTFEAETGLKLFLLKASNFAALVTRHAGSKFLQIEYILSRGVYQSPTPGAFPDTREGSPFLMALMGRAQAMRDRENELLNQKN